MDVLIYGAGVVGQIYGGRLAAAGHAVTLLARGVTARSLSERGVVLRRGDETVHGRPEVVTEVAAGRAFDIAFVCVRRDQLAAALPDLARLAARQLVLLLNLCTDLEHTRGLVGANRTLFGFPGVAGRRADDGTIEYVDVLQQHTTLEHCSGAERPVVDMLRRAGFAVDVSDDMATWLKTHAVFITAIGAAILATGGDSTVLAADRARVADMVAAVGEGFHALARQGITVTPTPLRIIFTVVPRFAAVRYWQRQLRGPVGTVAIGPHIRATRDTELAYLRADVRQLVAGHGPTPHLARLLSDHR
jgi:2-dehydropantoate 2-reductase